MDRHLQQDDDMNRPSAASTEATERPDLLAALEHVLDVWPAPSPEEFARLHRILTGHDSCGAALTGASPSEPSHHNEGSCELCTGWHDAEEAAFMNRKRATR